jgi:hypothetical protein
MPESCPVTVGGSRDVCPPQTPAVKKGNLNTQLDEPYASSEAFSPALGWYRRLIRSTNEYVIGVEFNGICYASGAGGFDVVKLPPNQASHRQR